jgi:hypothetical protein
MTAPSRGTSSSPVRLADLALERLDPGARQKRRERRSKWNVRLHPSDHRKTLRISTQNSVRSNSGLVSRRSFWVG